MRNLGCQSMRLSQGSQTLTLGFTGDTPPGFGFSPGRASLVKPRVRLCEPWGKGESFPQSRSNPCPNLPAAISSLTAAWARSSPARPGRQAPKRLSKLPAAPPTWWSLGATVYTVDEDKPKAEAFAVKGGRFLAVGGSDEIRKLAGKATQVIDGSGFVVVPGFIDAHSHPAEAGISELIDVNCDRSAIAEIKKAIQERAAKTPAERWVHGFKYDDTKLKDGRPLLRADLEEAALAIRFASCIAAGIPAWSTRQRSSWRGSTRRHPIRRGASSAATTRAN